MPKTIKKDSEHSPAFIAATALRQQKRKDYGGLDGYFPFDDKSYIHEIFKKAKRLVSLEERDVEPTHESVKDNLVDLINYASYYYEFLEDK